jgi:4-carboxymuconolactone decarboxylase
VKPDIVKALADGRRPDQMAEDEAVLYDLLTELQQNQSVSDGTYARALAKFGEPGIVEATSLAGYYALLAMVMNTARTPVPADAKAPLGSFPR